MVRPAVVREAPAELQVLLDQALRGGVTGYGLGEEEVEELGGGAEGWRGRLEEIGRKR